MNSKLEKDCVNAFIDSRYRERIIYELSSSSKKRLKALFRFSHNAEVLIDKSKLVFSGSELKKELIAKKVKQTKEVYVMSHKYLDGQIMDLDAAIKYTENEFSPVLIYMNELLIIKEEFESGNCKYYILENTD